MRNYLVENTALNCSATIAANSKSEAISTYKRDTPTQTGHLLNATLVANPADGKQQLAQSEISYQTQTKGAGGRTWHNWGGTIADKARATRVLGFLRADYPDRESQLVKITTITEVIA